MAFDPTTGTILTSDYNNYQVRRFTTAGAPDGVYGSRAVLGGQQPYGVAVDPATGDFVVDALLSYLRYSPTGTLLDTVSFAPEHAYYAPWIGLSPTNEDVYVVQSTGLDTQGANEVLMFDKNDKFLGTFGTDGSNCSSDDFGLIRGIDVDSAGNVYINDVSNHCVQVFSASGSFERSFSTKAQLSSNTRGLTVDRSNDVVYIANSAKQLVAAYSTSGTFLGTIGTPGSTVATPAVAEASWTGRVTRPSGRPGRSTSATTPASPSTPTTRCSTRATPGPSWSRSPTRRSRRPPAV